MASVPKTAAEIYTDDSSLGNPGKGGWAYVVVLNDEVVKTKSAGTKKATNNEMELSAAIEACKQAKTMQCIVSVITDSNYVKQGITSWIHNWKLNGWKTAQGKPVKNKELWKKLDDARDKVPILWKWTAAHVGTEYNEMADNLAKLAAQSA